MPPSVADAQPRNLRRKLTNGGEYVTSGTESGIKKKILDSTSEVERIAVEASKRQPIYSPTEKIKVVEVDNFPLLGKLVALRFLEWVQKNEGAVISLPTGRTPQHFINWVKHYLEHWEDADAQAEMRSYGVEVAGGKPDMWSLHFVQIDEFYPINPHQANTFYQYVSEHYIKGFGLDPAKAMLIDTWTLGCPEGTNAGDVFPDGVDDTLRFRAANTDQEQMQQDALRAVDLFCTSYEDKIREMGGIGFFLGGIGPDGHVAFNCRGSDLHSTTRLSPINYETQAAAATDLGGIETARKSQVITIGMGTVTYNPDAVAIVFAAGDAKAAVVARTIEHERTNMTPGSALADITGGCFYLTRSAASLLQRRIVEDTSRHAAAQGGGGPDLSDPVVHKTVINCALALSLRLQDLTAEHLEENEATRVLLYGGSKLTAKRKEDIRASVVGAVEAKLRAKIEYGLSSFDQRTFVHTAPHHDDIMLGYLPLVQHIVKEKSNDHIFCYATSGFNAVTNGFASSHLKQAAHAIKTIPALRELASAGHFAPAARNLNDDDDVDVALNGHALRDAKLEGQGFLRRILRITARIYQPAKVTAGQEPWRQGTWLAEKALEAAAYFDAQYSGQKDSPDMQTLKGMMREYEGDLLWGYHGYRAHKYVRHLRLGFYKGDLFTEDPKLDRDVVPCLQVLEEKQPAVVSVALDPEGSGPDTHYKVLQAVAAATKIYVGEKPAQRSGLKIWGYRNVWYRFHASEANLFYPVSLSDHAALCDSFNFAFVSQREASFPAPEYDGQFSHLAQRVQAEQYQQLSTLLGREFFKDHPDPRVRAARGLLFLHELNPDELQERCRALASDAEGK